jgi:hypothetical protein
VSRGNKKISEHFYITNLGSDQIILGYPWLHTFNPAINWENCKLEGPAVCIETLLYSHYPHLKELINKHTGVIPTQNKPNQVDLVVRSIETTQEVSMDKPTLEEELITNAITEVLTEAHTSNGLIETEFQIRRAEALK